MFVNKIKKKTFVLVAFFLVIAATGFASNKCETYAKTNYKIRPDSSPYKNAYTGLKTYKEKTMQYYTLRSYLELLEKKGGGTLTLKKGTYQIPCTLYVPSNVTIVLNNGVTIKKTSSTGSKKLPADLSLFELVPGSKAPATGKVTKYKSSKSVTIKGSGTASIDLNSIAKSTGIVIGHNNTVSITGISFKNMYDDSYITVAGSKKISVTGCTFTDAKSGSAPEGRYAIRLEVPESSIRTFPYTWSSYDGTLNNNISIKNNTFSGIVSGIGTVKYADKLYQKKITISGNTFSGLTNTGIRVLNWDSPKITGNTFINIPSGISAGGALSPSIYKNVFNDIEKPVIFAPGQNTGDGKSFAPTPNSVGAAQITLLKNNRANNCGLYYIQYQDSTDSSDIVKLAYFNDPEKNFVLTPGGTPFQNRYTDHKWYNEYTKDYYMFKACLEHLEEVGGGTITLSPGTYSITNTLYVPSNTTINFQDGAIINKGGTTGFDDNVFAPSLSIFQFVPPSLSNIVSSVGGYEGAHDISLIGHGTSVIDMLFYNCAKSIVMCHNTNITVRGIQFKNYFAHHFIELDASKNVLIENCVFTGSKYTDDKNDFKEAINLDTPDKNTGGFNQIWTNYDRTPNMNVIIQNNEFTDVLRAIGTHNYSVSPDDNTTQLYHTNIQILNNTITNTHSFAIRIMNWKDFFITGNTIKNVNNGKTAALLISGSVNPTITKNIIENASRPITLSSAIKSNTNRADYSYPTSHMFLDSAEKTGKNISDMLDNTLIDMKTSTDIKYFVGGSNKSTSTQTLFYEFDDDHISYTEPSPDPEAATPVPEDESTSEEDFSSD